MNPEKLPDSFMDVTVLTKESELDGIECIVLKGILNIISFSDSEAYQNFNADPLNPRVTVPYQLLGGAVIYDELASERR